MAGINTFLFLAIFIVIAKTRKKAFNDKETIDYQ